MGKIVMLVSMQFSLNTWKFIMHFTKNIIFIRDYKSIGSAPIFSFENIFFWEITLIWILGGLLKKLQRSDWDISFVTVKGLDIFLFILWTKHILAVNIETSFLWEVPLHQVYLQCFFGIYVPVFRLRKTSLPTRLQKRRFKTIRFSWRCER